MPKTIGFWNAEKLSNDVETIAQAAVDKATNDLNALLDNVKPGETTRALTRQKIKANGRHHPYGKGQESRTEKKERERRNICEKTLREQEIKLRKVQVAQRSIGSYDEVFYCEVMYNHTDAQSPLYLGAAVTLNVNCYASYDRSQVSQDLTHIAWPPNIQNNTTRFPAYRDLHGAGNGGVVRCYFWHAPSGSNGNIVVDVYQHLMTLGAPFILFGDLNAEPAQIQGGPKVPIAHIVQAGPTRISGRTLDYAITNVPSRVRLRKQDGTTNNFASIKRQYGSDHAFMVLELT